MVFCIKCGSALAPGAKFCSECGTRVASLEPRPSFDNASAPPPPHSNASAPAAARTTASDNSDDSQPRTECAICFDELANGESVACLTRADGQHRICRHFFHKRCADVLKSNTGSSCPICRERFVGILEIPKLDIDPQGWFRAMDVDRNGSLEKQEVIDALKAQVPADWARIEHEMVPEQWQRWDPDGDGHITYEELMGSDGLLQWFREQFPSHERGPCPPITRKLDWFMYWDEDNSGELDLEELIRAVIKTLKLSSDLSQVRSMRESLSAIWAIFDSDGSGGISRDEFVQSDGLADTLIAEIQQYHR